MSDDYSAICGITEQELLSQMQPDIERIAQAMKPMKKLVGIWNGSMTVIISARIVKIVTIRSAFSMPFRKKIIRAFGSLPVHPLSWLKCYSEWISVLIYWKRWKWKTKILLFRLMGQYVDVEVKNAIGRADVVIKMPDAIYVFDLR